MGWFRELVAAVKAGHFGAMVGLMFLLAMAATLLIGGLHVVFLLRNIE